MKKIAIQGIKGCYHHEAFLKYFGYKNESILECNNFQNLVEAVVTGTADQAVMAIHNSIVGSILSNYNLLLKYKLKISGEIFLAINHKLIGIKKNIKNVISHPMALSQCNNFFKKKT